jgi:hypothetical protein
MSLLDIPLDKITADDLRRLIDTGAAESLHADYKAATYGATPEQRREFLADISSFANSAGGDLIIGVTEQNGIPNGFRPFTDHPEPELRRLDDMARGGLQPTITNLRMRAVPSPAGGYVIIVRIPRSYNAPHQVVRDRVNQFWARSSASPKKYEPNVEDLRRLFTDPPHLADRIQSFRTDRLAKIGAGQTPIPLAAGGKVVLHVIPLPSFADSRLLDIVSAVAAGYHVPLPLDGPSGLNQHSVNLEGLVNYAGRPTAPPLSYAQFFRSGAIEGVSELGRNDEGNSYFVGRLLAKKIVFAVRQYLDVLKSFETGLPVYVFLSLCEVDECVFRHAPEGFPVETSPLRRNIVALPEVYIDSFSVDVPVAMRPVFNILWNAFGFLQCDLYDQQGRWIVEA